MSNISKDLLSAKPFSFSENINSIFVLGCGGTGSYVVANLSRLLYAMDSPPTLTLIDGDVVEEKNLLRQHFIEYDLGKNKASVLAERYSEVFGIEINSIEEEIKESAHLYRVMSGTGREATSSIIIGCVDNNASRKMIHEFANTKLSRKDNLFWVDCGNEEASGQVVLGSKISLTCKNEKTFNMPFVTEIYKEMLSDESQFNSDLSCAERAISAPQNMMTNVTAANIAMNCVQSILLHKAIRYHAVEFSIDNSFHKRLNTVENLESVERK